MFKRILNPWAVLLGLAAGVAVEEHYRADDGDVIQSMSGPAPTSQADSVAGRVGVRGLPTVEDWNRWQRRHSEGAGR